VAGLLKKINLLANSQVRAIDQENSPFVFLGTPNYFRALNTLFWRDQLMLKEKKDSVAKVDWLYRDFWGMWLDY
jgi:hypothetical protein